MRPPKMDDSGRTKYPVLFFVWVLGFGWYPCFLISNSYGGPESQKVNVEYKRDWHDYLVCTLQYIVVVVDGRGTGFKGRRLRNPVRYNMGFWETQDQINAARCVLYFFFFPILFCPLKLFPAFGLARTT